MKSRQAASEVRPSSAYSPAPPRQKMKHGKPGRGRKNKKPAKPRQRIARPHSMAIDLGRAVCQMAKLNSRMDRLSELLQAKPTADFPNAGSFDAIPDHSGIGESDEHRAAAILLDAVLTVDRDTPTQKTKEGRRTCPAERLAETRQKKTVLRFQYAVRRFVKDRYPASWGRILEDM